jgi:hypothetical protein
MLPYGFATLAQLKSRLEIGDTNHDELLQLLINGSAGAIERAAGRTLRREHARTEYFRGGGRAIRLGVAPVVKIHSVRESETRDFETSGSHEELTEGTDWVFDDADGQQEGETGVLRRLDGGKWLGSERSPGRVQVVYTGGFKSDEEAALENTAVTISSSDQIVDFVAKRAATLGVPSIHTIVDEASADLACVESATGDRYRPIFRFDTKNLLLPEWGIVSFEFWYARKRLTGSDIFYNMNLIESGDPASADAVSLFDAAGSGTTLEARDTDGTNYTLWRYQPSSDAQVALIQASLRRGYIGFAMVNIVGQATINFASRDHATSTYWPYLVIGHRRLVDDPFSTPDDLRHANLIQAGHEYTTRKSSGFLSQFARGAAGAAGGGFLKQSSALLPEVRDIALSYRRLV